MSLGLVCRDGGAVSTVGSLALGPYEGEAIPLYMGSERCMKFHTHTPIERIAQAVLPFVVLDVLLLPHKTR